MSTTTHPARSRRRQTRTGRRVCHRLTIVLIAPSRRSNLTSRPRLHLVAKSDYTYTDATRPRRPSSAAITCRPPPRPTPTPIVDGFDRTIQTKREAETANGWITKDTIYNSIGSVGSESLPYFSTAATYGAPTTTPALFVNYTYDAVGRPLSVANVVGTTTNTYSDWRLTVTDPLGNKKDLYKDAYGNLANVVEYATPASPATTTYTWNLIGKLTKLTDASANIRNFTYDLLGRLTGSEDLHASGDSTFGTTSRQYDLAGNLLQMYTPRGNTHQLHVRRPESRPHRECDDNSEPDRRRLSLRHLHEREGKTV